ncbi:Uncharacterised protein [Klebsiella quasipneumoniae]|nr:Uncharacterised protein [Klebsiella quasipneumoniae]
MWHPPGGGVENPRLGFDNWQRQLDRPRARERAAPQGRAKRVNPPSPPYFKKSSYASTGFFFACGTHRGGVENPRLGFDNWQRQLDRPRARERAAPTKTPGAFLNNACVGPAGASEASQSPPHRHIRDESLYASTGSFLFIFSAGESPPRKANPEANPLPFADTLR